MLEKNKEKSTISKELLEIRTVHHALQNGYRPTSIISELFTDTDLNCFRINCGVTDTDLVLLIRNYLSVTDAIQTPLESQKSIRDVCNQVCN